jgi:hypothetical protein
VLNFVAAMAMLGPATVTLEDYDQTVRDRLPANQKTFAIRQCAVSYEIGIGAVEPIEPFALFCPGFLVRIRKTLVG